MYISHHVFEMIDSGALTIVFDQRKKKEPLSTKKEQACSKTYEVTTNSDLLSVTTKNRGNILAHTNTMNKARIDSKTTYIFYIL